MVPFAPGGGPAVVSVLSAEVSVYLGSIPALLPHMKSAIHFTVRRCLLLPRHPHRAPVLLRETRVVDAQQN